MITSTSHTKARVACGPDAAQGARGQPHRGAPLARQCRSYTYYTYYMSYVYVIRIILYIALFIM